jgi:hypothetical protein
VSPRPVRRLHAAELNTKQGSDLAALDFSESNASPRQVEGALETLRQKPGLLGRGQGLRRHRPAGTMPGYLVHQFYLPVSGMVVATPRPTDCYVGGCSSELCTDDPDAMSACIFKPENECFRAATCARQPDLRCGWTPTGVACNVVSRIARWPRRPAAAAAVRRRPPQEPHRKKPARPWGPPLLLVGRRYSIL